MQKLQIKYPEDGVILIMQKDRLGDFSLQLTECERGTKNTHAPSNRSGQELTS